MNIPSNFYRIGHYPKINNKCDKVIQSERHAEPSISGNSTLKHCLVSFSKKKKTLKSEDLFCYQVFNTQCRMDVHMASLFVGGKKSVSERNT